MLVSDYPVKMLPKEIAVDREMLTKLTGQYPLTPAFVITVTEEDGELYAQATDSGKATSLTLHQNGVDRKPRGRTSARAAGNVNLLETFSRSLPDSPILQRPAQFSEPERWPSGLRRTLGKRV